MGSEVAFTARTASELVAGILVALPAALIFNGYVVDAAGWPIDPTAMLLVALAATAALICAPAHFLGSFTQSFFYAQVVSETFAVAMLWALLAFDQRPGRGTLVLFTLCGIAVFLTWPLWLPVPLLTLWVMMLARKTMPVAARVRYLAWCTGPIMLVAVAYTLPRLEGVEVLEMAGSIVHPGFILTAWQLTALTAVCLMTGLRKRRWQVIVIFTTVTLVETGAFFVLDLHEHNASQYHFYKMFFLLLYPMAIFAAGALDTNPGRWLRPDGLPYALAANLNGIPPSLRSTFEILHQCGSAGVIRRLGESSCPEVSAVPLDVVEIPPRQWTLANLVSSIFALLRRRSAS